MRFGFGFGSLAVDLEGLAFELGNAMGEADMWELGGMFDS